jgi:energy-coupling factor transport system substrate-specific component
MTTMDRAQPGAPTNPFTAWRTRDILLAAIVGVVFGVVFFAWNGFYAGLGWVVQPWADVVYGMWIVPVVLAPLLIRKPGAALFAELTAAGVSVLLGSPWGPDTLLSGFVQGAAAELIFAFTGYRLWSVAVLAVAAIASAAGAWIHDWTLYYADFAVDIQVLRLAIMAVSAVVFAVFGSLAIERSLRRAGVLGDTAA